MIISNYEYIKTSSLVKIRANLDKLKMFYKKTYYVE